MYARISRAKYKPESKEAVKTMIAELKGRLNEAPGVQHWISLLTSDGDLVVASFFLDEQALEDTAHINERRWENARHLLEATPQVVQGEVLAFVSA